MPKARSTCTRCSMRRQKCDRGQPCGRCVASKAGHLCTTKWTDGYDPRKHRQYPRRSPPPVPKDGPSTEQGASHIPPNNNTTWAPQSLSNPALTPQSLSSQDPDYRACSFPANPLDEPAHLPANEPTPAHDNIDFVTHGRTDYTDVSIGALLRSQVEPRKDASSVNKDRPLTLEQEAATGGGFSPAARLVEVYYIRALLPPKEAMFKMVEYHERYMIVWCGGTYHGPSLRKSLDTAFGDGTELDLLKLDWRWTALIFSILSASIIGSSEEISQAWGYSADDKVRLSKDWGNASITCLQLGEYASKYHIYSIQTILNMHQTEHLVGSSRQWAVFQGAALIIARGLGLHRLGRHVDDGKPASALPPERQEALLQREIGRRIWWALASQDWFCAISQGLYSIQRRHFTTIKPHHYDDETMAPVTDGRPTMTHYWHYTSEVAYLMVQYHDDMLTTDDLAAKYNIVLRYDAKLRALAQDALPICLSTTTPLQPPWPRWAKWGRLQLQASVAHKLVMIHQAFLAKSFKSALYAYSRWACTSASRHIIQLLCHERDAEEPQWWIEQALLCTAGICLALEVFHRERDEEAAAMVRDIRRAVEVLGLWESSVVARHGRRLLGALLAEYDRGVAEKSGDVNNDDCTTTLPKPPPTAPSEPTVSNAMAPAPGIPTEPSKATTSTTTNVDFLPADDTLFLDGGDVEMTGFENLFETLPFEVEGAALDDAFWESLMAVPNPQFYT